MLKVLVNSYTCCPNMGSEQGMGWNWIVNLAKYCELFIITEGEYRPQIEEWLNEPSNAGVSHNMHFYWNPVPQSTRDKCWNQGNWSFYPLYQKWQLETSLIAESICKAESIDILHQLNMIGFREPGYLWEVSRKTGIPFIWGPVDAKESFPMAYSAGAGVKTKLFLVLKNVITRFQLLFSKRVRNSVRQASYVISASTNSVNSFKRYFDIESPLINETGCSFCDEGTSTRSKTSNELNILWVGKMDFRKQLALALKTVSLLKDQPIKLHILGGGDASKYKMLASEYGIQEQCVWHGVVSHDKVQSIMKSSDILLFTSVAEGTPHVVLEALANDLPVVCFDTCGQGDVVNEKVGVKIPLSTPKDSANRFSEIISGLIKNNTSLEIMRRNCKERARELSWDNKVKELLEYYKLAIASKS